MRLSALETSFRDGILARDESVLAKIEAGNLTEQKRLNIYRNNVFSNYRNALEAVYPAIASLVGADYFRAAAHRYIERYASVSGDIHRFGEDFGELLASLPGAVDLAYLPDVARLEWAVHAAFHAANVERLDSRRLQAVPTDQYPNLRFVLNPAARLLKSHFPIWQIWRVNLPDYRGDQHVDLGEGPESLLVMRRNFVMEVEAIAAAEFAILDAFSRHESFGDALDVGVAIDPILDVGAFLQRYVHSETIVDFSV